MKTKLTNISKIIFFCCTFSIVLISCKETKKNEEELQTKTEVVEPFFKLSLAQWSLNKAVRFEGADPLDFAQKANELGFEGIEYVSQLYTAKIDSLGMPAVLDSLKKKSAQYQVENVLIMVDGEGDLASPDEAQQDEAVEKHKKWVDAANFLGCHSIRVNLFGTNDPETWKKTAAQGLSKLSDYAATKNVNVIVENHGGLSSNGAMLASVMKAVNKSNCGTLPDFGNFCLKREGGEVWGSPCIEEYDKYQGVSELMPHAKAVSAKSYDFNEAGDETEIDYVRMMQIVKDAGYEGFVGVEYEGEKLGEEAGIKATKALLIKAAKQLD